MPITALEIVGYRSIRQLRMPLRQLTVLVGGNGVGKTNLYRALELVRAAATGEFSHALAQEGGLAAVMWAGERRSHEEPRLKLGVTFDEVADLPTELSLDVGFVPQYEMEAGFSIPTAAAFPQEAQIKSELLQLLGRKRATLFERRGPTAWARDDDGRRVVALDAMLASETALAEVRGYPEVDVVRQTVAAWRFFHGFRSDQASPLRQPGLAVAAPQLTADGSNLAAVFATLRHIRQDTVDLDAAIADAFPGAELEVPMPERHASFAMRFADMPKRSFAAHELSDGTLQFLALAGALLSYRLPPLIALNEPETSLHPSLLPSLARLIAKAAERTQVLVVTHSEVLAQSIEDATGILPRQVIRQDGGTWLEGLGRLGEFVD